MNLGVDASVRHITPPRRRTGIRLRPGGERPAIRGIVRDAGRTVEEFRPLLK